MVDSMNWELVSIKVPAMIINFIVVSAVGNLPLRLQSFKENKQLLAISAAFSGGLFFTVGILHLLPEANENFEDYFQQQRSINNNNDLDDDDFPWAFMISVLSFSLILFIEKILTDNHHSHHSDGHPDSISPSQPLMLSRENSGDDKASLHQELNVNAEDAQNQNCVIQRIQQQHQIQQQQQHQGSPFLQPIIADENIEEIEISVFKEQINTQTKVANKLNLHQRLMNQITSMASQALQQNLQPYILSIAIGIHAIFEGLAIGIQTTWFNCLGIALAVLIHKAAEGFTLGIAFKNAHVNIKLATIMIFIQASMDPLGIIIGWILSSQGNLIQGIFTSISVGTFIYIATVEVIVEEFNLNRYRWSKFLFFMLAVAFSCSLWFIEKIAVK